ncbi:MAG: efflux transporter periplasmic adaptor subunit [Maricaulis sp.]|jgi:RND family efflux transporter MFP subunit|nr:efflux transporter periplasmic adaptor subunit [Maricaulis sp.]
MTLRALTIAFISLSLAACGGAPEPEARAPRPVQIETVTGGGLGRHYEFVGRVEARRAVDLSFQVGGQLAELAVTDGAAVSEGDLIAQLDLEELRRAEREARVQLQQAQSDLDRQQTLFDRGIAAAAARDSAQTQFDLRQVELGTARQNLQRGTLRAPFDGLISRVLVDNFTVVAPGQAIARIQDVGELRVSIPISEDLVATFRAEDLTLIEASFAFLPGQRFALEPRELVSEPDNASQTYRGILALPSDLPANILPGMTATVYAEFSPNADLPSSIRIPLSALAYAPDGSPFVYVFDAEAGAVNRRSVALGDFTEGAVRITDGLAAGERIATAGISSLQDGMAVRPLGGE